MDDIEMSLITDIFRHYNVEYDRECKVVNVKEPISVEDFIYLKQVLGVSTIDYKDIRVGGAKL